MKRWHQVALAVAALGLAATAAALGPAAEKAALGVAEAAPASVEPFALAELLTKAPPAVVVVAFDEAKPALRGAMAARAWGEDDEAFVANAPRARRVILAARDVVRADRLARRLAATGRDVAVVAGGVEAWEAAMRADPRAPGGGASGADWDRYRTRVALRRAFGEAASAPTPVVAPRAPAAVAQPAAPKKREGC